MKKLFGLEKTKVSKAASQETSATNTSHSHGQDPPIFSAFSSQATPRQSRTLRRSDSADRWSMVNKPVTPTPQSPDELLPNPHPHSARTAPLASPPRSTSPVVAPPSSKKKAQTPAALGILRALDPTHTSEVPAAEQLRKKPFWNAHKETTKDRPHKLTREPTSNNALNIAPEAELTRMIGYLTATSSEEWELVMDVCDRASSCEAAAKEAIRALRREFKYGEPSAQLAAARLWAIMLRNSSDTFIIQSTSKKFLDVIEDLLASSRTSPVVRERLLDVIAAAAYASGSHTAKDGFKGLWRKVKPADKPEEGIPFDTNDSMFNPVSAITPPAESDRPKKKHHSSRNRIIPLEEDIIRLFQECKLGSGNATLLLENIKFARPQDLDGEVIQEFHQKCLNSHELIYAQIPWATSQADKSRLDAQNVSETGVDLVPAGETEAEKLLAALLLANSELQEAINVYEDLKRVGLERQAEEQSKKEWKMDRTIVTQLEQSHINNGTSSLAGIPPPPPIPSLTHANHSYDGDRDHLAPPPLPPLGPRSPAIIHNRARSRSPSPARTPSPTHHNLHSYSQTRNNIYGSSIGGPTNSSSSLPAIRALPSGLIAGNGGLRPQPHIGYPSSNYSTSNYTNLQDSDYSPTDEDLSPPMPSAKALGKRRLADDNLPLPSREQSPASSVNSHSAFYPHSPPLSDPYDSFPSHLNDDTASISSNSSNNNNINSTSNKAPVHYVYDAAAERTQARILQLKEAEERDWEKKKGVLNARRSTMRSK